jgi:BirA family biotin operon repressor/biotin-[acetyl-CoA-carboxylase] ligase
VAEWGAGAAGLVIWADHQTAGRGRIQNRAWVDEKGKNLSFTIIKYFPAIPPLLSLAAGLAVLQSVEALISPRSEVRAEIKWPNDIMLGGKKICGILCEASVRGSGGSLPCCALIGIGLNVGQTAFPQELKDKATSLALAGIRAEPESLLKDILAGLEKLLDNAGKAEVLIPLINKRLYKKGEIISFRPGAAVSDSVLRGRLTGITENGGLCLLTDFGEKNYISGEIVL